MVSRTKTGDVTNAVFSTIRKRHNVVDFSIDFAFECFKGWVGAILNLAAM
jgi:hypothetical protein